MISVIDNFSNSMIKSSKVLNESVFIEKVFDKPTIFFNNEVADYNLHFHFGLKNDSNIDKTVTICVDCDASTSFGNKNIRVWLSDDRKGEYSKINILEGSTDNLGRYVFPVNVRKKSNIFLANFLPYKYLFELEKIENLSKLVNAKKRVIGKTIEKRDLIAYELGNVKVKPTILITSGYHPPEADCNASIAILELFKDRKIREKILSKISVVFIPFVNPDGLVNNKQGSNAKDLNFYWDFRVDDIQNSPESYFIWKYCKTIFPNIYFDFHSYTFQKKEASSYMKPLFFYSGARVKKLASEMHERVKTQCNGNFVGGNNTCVPSTLQYKLTRKFNTITFAKFHLHMKDGLHQSRTLSKDCFLDIVNVISKEDISEKKYFMLKPHGVIHTPFSSIFKRLAFMFFWNRFYFHFFKKEGIVQSFSKALLIANSKIKQSSTRRNTD